MDELRAVLAKTSPEKRRGLSDILKADGIEVSMLEDALWRNSRSVFGRILGDKPVYSSVVKQVADKLDIPYSGVETKTLEVRIARHVFQTVWEKMTPEQKEKMEDELRRMAQKFDKGGELAKSASIFAALTAAKLSGFGVYLLASTSLGALTGAVGTTLPFIVYTTMSSAIATVLGPVGLIGAGLFAIWKLSGPNYQRLISAIVYVSMLRSEQELREEERGSKIIVYVAAAFLLAAVLVAGIFWFL